MGKVLKRTMDLRIKREYDYVGKNETRINIDTLQQLHNGVDDDGDYKHKWIDIPIVINVPGHTVLDD